MEKGRTKNIQKFINNIKKEVYKNEKMWQGQ